VGIYLRTRGERLDYRFLGEAPPEFWWRSYREVTDPERPTILLESADGGWRLYVAGIDSGRLDVTDTPIQFTLAIDGRHAETDSATRDLAMGVIAKSMAGLAQPRGLFIASSELAERLPRDAVERMLTSPGAVTRKQAEDAVLAAYRDTQVSPAVGDPPPHTWLGGARPLLSCRAGQGKPWQSTCSSMTTMPSGSFPPARTLPSSACSRSSLGRSWMAR
jgi:hypothetical protein